MNIDQYYMELKNKLSNRPILLDNTDDFLFVLVNTVKAMIENTEWTGLPSAVWSWLPLCRKTVLRS